MGCSQRKQVRNKKEIEKRISPVLQQKRTYRQEKIERVDSIKHFLHTNENAMHEEDIFKEYMNLYNEFKLYSFDSAYHYATQLCKIANELNSSGYKISAKTQLGYILARGGFFKKLSTLYLQYKLKKMHYLTSCYRIIISASAVFIMIWQTIQRMMYFLRNIIN